MELLEADAELLPAILRLVDTFHGLPLLRNVALVRAMDAGFSLCRALGREVSEQLWEECGQLSSGERHVVWLTENTASVVIQ